MDKWIVGAVVVIVVAFMAAVAWTYGTYCAENDAALSKYIYDQCNTHWYSSAPLCGRTAAEASCKRWARW